MARTKTTRRTYNFGAPQRTEFNPRDPGTSLAEEPAQDMSVSQPQDMSVRQPQETCSAIQVHTSEESATASDAPAKTSEMLSTEPETLDLEDLPGPVFQTSLITKSTHDNADSVDVEEIGVNEERTEVTSIPQDGSLDKNDDIINLTSPVTECTQDNADSNDVEETGVNEERTQATSKRQEGSLNKNDDIINLTSPSASTKITQENAASVDVEATGVNEERTAVTPVPQEGYLDENDDSLNLKSPILGCRTRKISNGRVRVKKSDDWSTSSGLLSRSHSTNLIDRDDSLSNICISPDLPLNLTWDSSMKENAANFRPVTPDNLLIPVDEIFSPSTQKQIRTTIWALFPNGPPPPPPIKPVRRPKKGDVPYIVNCTKRPRVPSPKSLSVFKGDKYGIDSNSNCDEDEQSTPEKRAKRGPNGSASISKSKFNHQSNEIAERLKLYEKIDRLVGRTPLEQPVGYMKRAFSPLPSTSTDNETIMKNDRHFSESLNCDFYVDEDEDLPEVLLEPISLKINKKPKELTSPIVSKYIKKEKDHEDNVLNDINEDLNNNNNNELITIDDDYCEIEFDKFMPKEKILDYSDYGPKKEQEKSPTTKSPLKPSPPSAIPSSDVICVDEIFSRNLSILRANNKIPNGTDSNQSDLVTEVPDTLEPLNMSRDSTWAPAWSGEVEFVSETRTERPNSSTDNLSDVQIVSESLASSQNKHKEMMNGLQQFLTCLESYGKRKTRNQAKKKTKKTKTKDSPSVPGNSSNTAPLVNDENTAPAHENAHVNNNLPSVNQVDNNSGTPTASFSSPGKRLGDCPICLESLPIGSIASTNCGHVFCLECIKRSLKTTGKRCPTCRKQLKGVGYHQVFL